MAVSKRKQIAALNNKKPPETLVDHLVAAWPEIISGKAFYKLFFDARWTWLMGLLVIALEVFVNLVVIRRVNYTEIDWSTYVQQVECFLNGTLHYEDIGGSTGPLVYPAGHLYIYTILYFLTNRGTSVVVAQHIFAALYLINLAAVFRIYSKICKVPPYVLLLMCCTSYRVHSIFVLRLFNDPIAMCLFYVAVNLFIDERWTLGSFIYSLGVSVKMNILLFAPGLLLLFLERLGLRKTLHCLLVCASVQLLLGLPFLATSPLGYVGRAFDLGRVFMYKWTVNWRLVPEEMFASRAFHATLLVAHLACLALFQSTRWLALLKWHPRKNRVESGRAPSAEGSATELGLTLFTANLVGIAFSRSLHYQFYVWYFHSLPLLVWFAGFSQVFSLCILGLVELCWNTYPSTVWSSSLLHAMHLLVLVGLFRSQRKSQLEAPKLPVD